ncbi:MAG: hypothetical protein R3F05_16515 [Planctomycetota bacterium]
MTATRCVGSISEIVLRQEAAASGAVLVGDLAAWTPDLLGAALGVTNIAELPTVGAEGRA